MASASGATCSREARRAGIRGHAEKLVQDANLQHQAEALDRPGCDEQAAQLRGDPLARQPRQAGPLQAARVERGRVRGSRAEARMEAEEAQDTEIVLANPGSRVADEAHMAAQEVGAAAERIVETAIEIAAHGVEGEVPAGGILDEVVGKGDDGTPPVGSDVAPERGDLEAAGARMRRHRAMRQTRRHHLEPCRLQKGQRTLRRLLRRDVDVQLVERGIDERVPHAAAHEARVPPAALERRHDAPRLRCGQPARPGQRASLAHRPAGSGPAGWADPPTSRGAT